jgi:GDPmannose 4,6-dehydratase
MTKRALIIGIGGQDGSILADILLGLKYEVHGVHRRSSVDNLTRIHHCRDKITLHRGDLLDATSIHRILKEVQPEEIYNEADQDNIDWSTNLPSYSAQVSYVAVCTLLEQIQRTVPQAKVFQPCSVMMFGDADAPQKETTPFRPLSPYAIAKTAAYHLCDYYRTVHGLFVSTAILGNHDSERRGKEYLLHYICDTAKAISRCEKNELVINNPDALVDIGCAWEYMIAVQKMMQLDKPTDLLLASNAPVTIREIVDYVFSRFGLSMSRMVVDQSKARPGPVHNLHGDTFKAFKMIGFNPKVTWKQLCLRILESNT